MFYTLAMILAVQGAECREIPIPQQDGQPKSTLMCRGADGTWREAGAPAISAAAPATTPRRAKAARPKAAPAVLPAEAAVAVAGPECRQMAVAQADGSYAPTTMCKAADGKWRSPNAPVAPATVVGSQPAGCKSQSKKNRWGNVFGKVGEGLFSSGIGKLGIRPDLGLRRDVQAALTDSFACALDSAEQNKAVAASNKAVAGKLGQPVTWVSDTRPGVTGSSTSTGETRLADGTTCRAVTDIVIVSGEETLVQKQLCRPPGATGYSLTPSA